MPKPLEQQKKMKRLITNIHFWIWAAIHSPKFKDFRIGLSRLMEVNAYCTSYYTYKKQKFVINVSFFTPDFVYEVDSVAAQNYVKATKNCVLEDLFDFDDIPF